MNGIPTISHSLNFKGSLFLLLSASMGFAQEGSINERTLEHGGTIRSYVLYVPASYDGTTEWPLIVSYHGYRVDLNNHMNGTRMNIEAYVARYIVAYPRGLDVIHPRGTAPGWNFTGQLSENDDVDFSLEVINDIKADYRINPSRVHLTGWSMGAGIAYNVACLH